MNVSGENVKVWRRDVEGRNGTFYRYSVSISKKKEDGSYTNIYVPIHFAKGCNAPEVIPNGAVCDFSGFLSVDTFTGKDGEVKTLNIVAMKARFEDLDDDGFDDSFAQAEGDLPF